MIDIIKNRIELTDYWDAKVLDIRIMYFGDEIDIYYYDNEDTCWSISFLQCNYVQYVTDSETRSIQYVKDMKSSQLGYYMQSVNVDNSIHEGMKFDVKLDLSLMEMFISCNEIIIKKVVISDLDLFWVL